jgi:hypothetical protein
VRIRVRVRVRVRARASVRIRVRVRVRVSLQVSPCVGRSVLDVPRAQHWRLPAAVVDRLVEVLPKDGADHILE